ncbi:MAG: flagellar assembly protein FliH [Gammaproteobacteria bacterium]|nr:flagellar assembly protein FliH [Gammaproteobacteria bacterium]
MSKLIRSEDVEAAYQAWRVPEVAGVRAGRGAHEERSRTNRPAAPMSAAQIEQARKEGYAQGHEEGLRAGQQEIHRQVQRLEQLLVALRQPFAELDAAVEEQLSQLAMLVARHLVRRELKADPGQVVAVVREALAALPITSRMVRLHLHPEDATLVREAFSLNEEEAHIQVLDDPVQSRGGCRVQTDNSQIDASVETRLNALIAQVLGGEREEDASA